jgi:alpha-tubulin suppressor-like RCC1 family protein
MSISLPLIYSLPRLIRNEFLSILVELVLLHTDLLFVIFKFVKLETIISILKLSYYFDNILNKSNTLEFLRKKAQKETKLNAHNYTLNDIIRLSQLHTTSNIGIYNSNLFVIKTDDKLYKWSMEKNDAWMHLPLLTTKNTRISYISGLFNLNWKHATHVKSIAWNNNKMTQFNIVKILGIGKDTLALMECGKVMNISLEEYFTTECWGIHVSLNDYSTKEYTENKFYTLDNKIVDISSGVKHTLLLCDNGLVYSFGNNEYGQLGYYDFEKGSTPTLIPDLSDVIQISCGNFYSVVLTKDGLIYSFGNNYKGQLGLCTETHPLYTSYTTFPVRASELKDIIQIATGNHHTLALRNDGRVYAFGCNYCGQLGISGNNAGIPTLISNLENVEKIYAKYNISIFIMKNGDIIEMKENKQIVLGSMYN